LKGVSIGEGTVVGAGSVVTKSLPPGVIAVGNPAKVLREIDAWSDLEKMAGLAGSDRVLFSLDLHQGRPVQHLDPGPRLERISPEELVGRVVSIGVAGLIVIDLADVGSAAGPSTGPLIQRLQANYRLPVYAGGGVRDRRDVDALLEAGAVGVLVGTAVHNGELLIADC